MTAVNHRASPCAGKPATQETKVIRISCPHFSISIRKRSKRQSAVAGAAYQSGEALFSEYDGKTKNYRYKSSEIVAKGILLPENAPPEYADRQALWNAVEKVESQWNAQLARGIIAALPRELSKQAYEPLVREYCQEQFVSRGMIADFAIHDKGDGNPHVHIMLTMRAMGENGKWLPKAHKVYDLDESGNRIRLPSGEWKSHKQDTVDWNDKRYAEVWRSAWANAVNHCFEKNGVAERLDLRSFARQGKEELPTIHLGAAVAHMEQKGISTEIGNYNRQVKAHNGKLAALKRAFAELTAWLKTAAEKITALTEKETQPLSVMDFVNAYFDLRKEQRFDWNRYAKQKGTIVDLKQHARIFNWLQEMKIFTMDDFNALLNAQKPIFDAVSANEKRIRRLEAGIRYLDVVSHLQPIADKSKRGFQSARGKYADAHKVELTEYRKAVRYLKANGISIDDREKLSAEMELLQKNNESLHSELQDTEIIRQIRYCIDTVLHEADIPEKKKSVLEMLHAPIPSKHSKEDPSKHEPTL